MDVFTVIAWVGTIMAVLLVMADLLGLDGIFGGFFEIRAITAFGCGFGWTGSIMQDAGFPILATLAASSIMGALIGGLMLFVVAAFARLSKPHEQGLEVLVKSKAEVMAVDGVSNELRVRALFRGHLHEFSAIAEGFSPSQGQIVIVEKVNPTGKLVVAADRG